WDPSTGEEVGRVRVPGDRVDHLSFAADGKTLTAGSGAVVVWDVAAGREVVRTGPPASGSAVLSPDGRLACDNYPGADGALRLRDARTGREVRRLQGFPRSVSAIVFSADGKYLAAAFHTESPSMLLWETATGTRLWEGRAGDRAFNVLAFSPDGRSLASGSSDGLVRLWEVATGKERHCFRGHLGGVVSLAFSPDGRRLVSGGEETRGVVWAVLGPPRPAGEPEDLSAGGRAGLWDDLAAADAPRGYRALCRLAAAPGQAVRLLGEHLRPAGAV